MTKKAICSLLFATTVLCLSTAASYAGDEHLAREYMEKSGFSEGVVKFVKANSGGMSVNPIDLSAVESAYVLSLAAHLSNQELKALLKAYDLPGYRSAMQKMPQVSAEMMAVAYKETMAGIEKTTARKKSR